MDERRRDELTGLVRRPGELRALRELVDWLKALDDAVESQQCGLELVKA
jgi:hypothetical protein